MGVYHNFEKMKPQLFFFLKKPSLVWKEGKSKCLSFGTDFFRTLKSI